MKKTQKKLSDEACEVVKMINELAVDFMFNAYETLPADMKIRLNNVTKKTQKMMDDKTILP